LLARSLATQGAPPLAWRGPHARGAARPSEGLFHRRSGPRHRSRP
jgi:hypothetical protein